MDSQRRREGAGGSHGNRPGLGSGLRSEAPAPDGRGHGGGGALAAHRLQRKPEEPGPRNRRRYRQGSSAIQRRPPVRQGERGGVEKPGSGAGLDEPDELRGDAAPCRLHRGSAGGGGPWGGTGRDRNRRVGARAGAHRNRPTGASPRSIRGAAGIGSATGQFRVARGVRTADGVAVAEGKTAAGEGRGGRWADGGNSWIDRGQCGGPLGGVRSLVGSYGGQAESGTGGRNSSIRDSNASP